MIRLQIVCMSRSAFTSIRKKFTEEGNLIDLHKVKRNSKVGATRATSELHFKNQLQLIK